MARVGSRAAEGLGLGLVLGFAVAIAVGAWADLPPKSEAPDPEVKLSSAADAVVSRVTDPVRRTPVVEAVQRVAPAVVSITTVVPAKSPFARHYGQRLTSGEGSGVVIEADGIVLTNAHVVEAASGITATLADGRSFEADIVGMAAELDLAVLRLRDAEGLSTVSIGQSGDLMLGEPVIAIGNPFGLGHTVTTGVVSAVRRPLETDERVYQDFIQTDASINPGNSGGPLLDAHGDLIGINTAIRPDAEGIGFAIPVDRAIKVARDLVDFGTVQIPWLGVDLDDVRLRFAQGLLTAARVKRVYPESPAAAAGVMLGDVVIDIDGRTIQGRADLNAYLAGFEPDRAVALTLIRGQQRLRAEMNTVRLPDEMIDASLQRTLGIEFADAAAGVRGSGVLVTGAAPGGSFVRSGLRTGDRILAMNGQKVRSGADLREAVGRAKSGHRPTAMLTIRRGGVVGRVDVAI